jgi:hypothetical protein
LNVSEYGEYLPTARKMADTFLQCARESEQQSGSDPTLWYLRSFPYTQEAFEIRLAQIYDDLAAQSITPYDPSDDITYKSFDDVVERIRQFAPFNQLDGTWLRNIAPGGPLDVVRSLLFSIWMDEAGDGKPEWNHANLYTTLMRSVGIYPPPVNSLEYANSPDFLDSAFVQPALMLVLSQFTEDYLPEIIGYTLNIEWQVLELWPTVKLFEYYKIDSHFYRLHIGIDNAAEGHGARTKAAIHDYLDAIRTSQGEEEMQAIWQRLWNGFVAADQLGSLGTDLPNMLQNKPSLATQVQDMINRKAPFASLNHGNAPALTDSHNNTKPLNEWFDDPQGLLDALTSSGWLIPGRPDISPFFRMVSFEGPMFMVFTEDELKLWSDYTLSLSPAPPAAPVQQVTRESEAAAAPAVSSADAMVQIISEESPRATQIPLHGEHYLFGPDPQQPGRIIPGPVLWWVGQTPEVFLQALRHPDSHMVTPGIPDQSPFYTFWIASGQGPMGNVFDKPSKIEGYPTRRDVVFQWIKDNCPLPADAVVLSAIAAPEADMSLVIQQQYAPRLWLNTPASVWRRVSPDAKLTGPSAIH